MVSSREASRAAVRIAYRVFGPRVRELIAEYGYDGVAAVVSRLAGGYDTPPATIALEPKEPRKRAPGGGARGAPFSKLADKVRKRLEFEDRSEPSNAPPKKMPRNGKAKSYVHKDGKYHGKFARGKKRSFGKVKYPCVCRDERPLVVSDPECSYVAHCTHPPKYMLRMIMMALTERYFTKCGIKIMNWLDLMPAMFAVGTPANPVGVKVFMQVQDRIGSGTGARGQARRITLFDSAATNIAWITFVDTMAAALALNISNGTQPFSNDLEVFEIQWLPDARSNETQLVTQIWDARDIMVEIKGVSHLHVQNRTEGGDGTTAENALSTSIYANPLHGKQYTFKGTGLRLRPNYNSPGRENVQLVCDSVTGLQFLEASNSVVSEQLRDSLREPPNARFFKNVDSSKSIRLEPGAIKKSYVTSTERKSFNQWLRAYYSWLSSGNSLTGTESSSTSITGTVSKYAHVYPGAGALVAMEKVCAIADLATNHVTLACERDAQYFSRMYMKRRNYIPTVTNKLTPITGNTAP